MQVTIESGHVIIKVPVDKVCPVSKSGKSRIVYTSGGFIRTAASVDGKQVSVGLNVIIPK